MDSKFIFAINWNNISSAQGQFGHEFLKKRIPLGKKSGFLTLNTELVVRIRTSKGIIANDEEAKLNEHNENYSLFTKYFDDIAFTLSNINGPCYLFVIIEGSAAGARAILYPISENLWSDLRNKDESIRLEAFDLPPNKVTIIDAPNLLSSVIFWLSNSDSELLATRSKRFLNDPHILTQLFAHVLKVRSEDNLSSISLMRTVADIMREVLEPRIKRIPKNHAQTWQDFAHQQITYSDGGMSRIVGFPGADPVGVRVGFYSVIPGERDMNIRESWKMYSYIIGDVLNDYSSIRSESYETDTRHLQECARYILEALSILIHLDNEKNTSKMVFMHGPLQNRFATYDRNEPGYIPSVNKSFLEEYDITKEEIEDKVKYIPTDHHSEKMWNQPIPIYLWIMKKFEAASIPIVGVVERANSTGYSEAILNILSQKNLIRESLRKKLRNDIIKYDLGDEFLFGCILEEGEYIEPISFIKNIERRAHDEWQPIVEQFPSTYTTMLKTSANRFPFRVELNKEFPEPIISRVMNLLYHTSLLLPHYSFPVGIDIADKYAKIPDWLSKGISTNLTALVLQKVMNTGNEKMLRQVRQILALSPRDFFYRPKP